MFLNREEELSEIRKAAERCRGRNGGILVYGRRRVGKSALIRKALEDFDGIYAEYECQEALFATNMRALSSQIAEALSSPALSYIQDMDILLKEICRSGKRIALFIDEYQFLRASYKEGNLDSVFQRLLDSEEGEVFLVLCGSYISAMEDVINRKSPLYGRFESILFVKPFCYLEASAFYPELNPMGKIAFYSVFGGMPFVLEKIRPEESLEENIMELLLSPYSGVRMAIEETLLKEISKIELAQSILDFIGNGRRKNSNIAQSLNISDQLSSYTIQRLIKMGLLKKTYPINDPGNEKKTFIEIADNLVRFYYSLVYRKRNELDRLGMKAFFRSRIEESLGTFISYRFENIVDEFIGCSLKAMPSLDIMDYGRYWYDIPAERRNGEFDNAIKTSNGYLIIESKYLSSPMTRSLMEEEKNKMLSIPKLGIQAIGFASASGFEEDILGYLQIDGSDLYDEENLGNVFSGFIGLRPENTN